MKIAQLVGATAYLRLSLTKPYLYPYFPHLTVLILNNVICRYSIIIHNNDTSLNISTDKHYEYITIFESILTKYENFHVLQNEIWKVG